MISGATDSPSDRSRGKEEARTGSSVLFGEGLIDRSLRANPLRLFLVDLIRFGGERHHDRSLQEAPGHTRFGAASLERGCEPCNSPASAELIKRACFREMGLCAKAGTATRHNKRISIFWTNITSGQLAIPPFGFEVTPFSLSFGF